MMALLHSTLLNMLTAEPLTLTLSLGEREQPLTFGFIIDDRRSYSGSRHPKNLR